MNIKAAGAVITKAPSGRLRTVFDRNISFLCRRNDLAFTARFALALKDPDHILGIFFRECDLKAALGGQVRSGSMLDLSLAVQKSFLRFMGFSDELLARVEQARNDKNKSLISAFRGFHPGTDNGAEVEHRFEEALVPRLPDGFFDNLDTIERLLDSIPPAHRDLKIKYRVIGGRIALDLIDESKEEDLSGESFQELENPDEMPIHERALWLTKTCELNDIDNNWWKVIERAERLEQSGKKTLSLRIARSMLDATVISDARLPNAYSRSIYKALTLLAKIKGKSVVHKYLDRLPIFPTKEFKDEFNFDYQRLNLLIKILDEILSEDKVATALLIKLVLPIINADAPYNDILLMVKILAENKRHRMADLLVDSYGYFNGEERVMARAIIASHPHEIDLTPETPSFRFRS